MKKKKIDLIDEVKNKRRYPGPSKRVTHKKRPVTITGFLDAGNIRLKVTALPENWEKLERYLDDEDFISEFIEQFINPALDSFRGKALRGKHKSQYWLAKDIKDKASALYPFLTYWCKKEQPEYLKKLIKKAEEDEYGEYIKENLAKGLTEYCMWKLYGKDADRLGLKPFDDPTTFYQVYILGNKRAARNIKLSMKGRTQEEISNLPSFNAIFKTLKVI